MMKQNKGTEDLRNFYEEKNGWIFICAKNILRLCDFGMIMV